MEKHGVDLKSISRFVAYYEQDGSLDARRDYRSLSPAERNVSGVDLNAMHLNCEYNVNYPEIVKRAQHYFS